MNYQRICYQCLREKDTDSSVCPVCGFDNSRAPADDRFLLPGTPLDGRYFVGIQTLLTPHFIQYNSLDIHLGQKVVLQEVYAEEDCRREDHIFVRARPGREEHFQEVLNRAVREAKSASPEKVQRDRSRYLLNSFLENGTAYLVYPSLEKEDQKEEEYRQRKRKGKRKRVLGVFGSILLMAGIFLATIAGVITLSFRLRPDLKQRAAVRIEQLKKDKGIDLTWIAKEDGES